MTPKKDKKKSGDSDGNKSDSKENDLENPADD